MNPHPVTLDGTWISGCTQAKEGKNSLFSSYNYTITIAKGVITMNARLYPTSDCSGEAVSIQMAGQIGQGARADELVFKIDGQENAVTYSVNEKELRLVTHDEPPQTMLLQRATPLPASLDGTWAAPCENQKAGGLFSSYSHTVTIAKGVFTLDARLYPTDNCSGESVNTTITGRVSRGARADELVFEVAGDGQRSTATYTVSQRELRLVTQDDPARTITYQRQ